MTISLPGSKKMRSQKLYNMNEEEYRAHTRQRLAEARQEYFGKKPSAVPQALTTVALLIMATLVCLHYFGWLKIG
ncbi:MAG TPA: hypothetical protein VMZ52_14595 [Bryobacteraceae bacterium]|nr:hypothetical protein [Bryobacteraceae bacterium]